MEIKFYCPLWGSESLDFKEFCKRAKQAGYDGVELSFPRDENKKTDMLNTIRSFDLAHIAQHWETSDQDFKEHKRHYRQRLENLVNTSPKFINSQTGKDYFSFEQNLELISVADKIANDTGIRIIHETHRGKFSFACHITAAFLNKMPNLRLNLDISHWCCVAESFLDDQKEAVQLAIFRTDHIHARIGHSQSAQIQDPRASEWFEAVGKHILWWKQVIDRAKTEGKNEFGITPEFGPYPYMVLQPFTRQPIVDQWTVNTYMKELLKKELLN